MNNFENMLNNNFAFINNGIMKNKGKYMKINLMNMNNNYYINQPKKNNYFIPYPVNNINNNYNINYNHKRKKTLSKKKIQNNNNNLNKIGEEIKLLQNKIIKLNNMVQKNIVNNDYNDNFLYNNFITRFNY